MKYKGFVYIVLILLLFFVFGYFIYTGTHVGEVNVNEIQP